jgi:uncharacterized protein YjiK
MNCRARTSCFVLISILFNCLSAQVITTVAGNGVSTYAGDGGPAINASISEPEGVAVDANGNIFIVDEDNNVIRKVNTSGIISTFAGTGAIGYSGDGGDATLAKLNMPAGATMDQAGNLYIADTWNHVIRKVDLLGKISTVAGQGISGYGGDNGQATSAYLSLPEGIAVDNNGNLYISDSGNNRVRKVDALGVITTLAGTGMAGYGGDNGMANAALLNYPSGIVFDTASGNIYVADENNNRIRKIDGSGMITTFAGTGVAGFGGDGGAASAATLSAAEGVAVDTAGNIYISDSGNSRVRKVNTSGIIQTYAGNGSAGFSGDGGPAIAAKLFTQKGLATDVSGNLYIAEYFNSRVRKVSVCASPLSVTITGADTICFGDSTTLNVSGATNYTWSANAGSTTADHVVVKPTSTSTYSIVAVSGQCAAVDSFSVVVKNCATEIQARKDVEIIIYPNPVSDRLYVRAPAGSRAQVFDPFGVKIYEFACEKPVDMSLLPPGMYYVRVVNEFDSIGRYILKL